jgi:hypothetical protein
MPTKFIDLTPKDDFEINCGHSYLVSLGGAMTNRNTANTQGAKVSIATVAF